MDKSAKKKVSKYDLKKLASLGLASGLMMAAAPVQADTAGQLSGTYLAHSCGGGGSGHQCGGQSGNNQGGQSQWQNQNRQQTPRQSSCNATSQRNPSQSCNSKNGCGGTQNYSNVPYYNPSNSIADNDAAPKVTAAAMSDSEFMSQLNAQSKATFQSMSPEGKALAMKLAQQECKGKNTCKGLNSCKGKGNDCAGKGSCKGTSSDKFKDKNLAVKVAGMKMAEKREGSLNPK